MLPVLQAVLVAPVAGHLFVTAISCLILSFLVAEERSVMTSSIWVTMYWCSLSWFGPPILFGPPALSSRARSSARLWTSLADFHRSCRVVYCRVVYCIVE